MNVALRLSGVDHDTLRRLLAACSRNREEFGVAADDGPTWAPRVCCEGPELFGVHIARCSPSLAALLATVADGGKP